MVYLRETIALTRSSELQEMYAAFIVAVANNYWTESSKKRLSAKLLEIAASNSDKTVIDVYTSVSACFEIFANEIHEAEKREKEMKRKKRQTPSTMRKSRVEIACSKTNLKEQENLVLNALKEYATDRSFETRRRERTWCSSTRMSIRVTLIICINLEKQRSNAHSIYNEKHRYDTYETSILVLESSQSKTTIESNSS
jgi:hypothetical protein